MQLSNWGNYPKIETTMLSPATIEALCQEALASNSVLARGLGRCYGDSACNDTLVLSCLRLQHMLSFDDSSGVLVAEAGVSLAEIVDCFAPRGWFLPVTPGTKFVTLGGAIASDVHGKNHHVTGTFGQHVLWMDVLTAEKGIVRCSCEEHTDLFHATCGGQGLTGIVLRVALQLVRIPSVWIEQHTVKAKNLFEIMQAFEEYKHSPYSVAWIDCLQKGKHLGRSVLMYGDFLHRKALTGKHALNATALPKKAPLSVPFDFPSMALNSFSVRAFNALYYGKAPQGHAQSVVSYNTFFYPLDSIDMWNRIYGKRGFTQYQFVVPKESAAEALQKILQKIAHSGQGSFLAVLKLFGKQQNPQGNISFPSEGYTLALDFPITKTLFPLLNELDAMVLDYGGRHYLTKDARMSATTLRRGYGEKLDEFLEIKHKWDPKVLFKSTQAQRLHLL